MTTYEDRYCVQGPDRLDMHMAYADAHSEVPRHAVFKVKDNLNPNREIGLEVKITGLKHKGKSGNQHIISGQIVCLHQAGHPKSPHEFPHKNSVRIIYRTDTKKGPMRIFKH